VANSNRALVATVIAEIRSHLEAARLIEREKIARLDIQAQKLRCDAAMRFFANARGIKDECARTGSSVKQMFGCGERHLQKIRQLFRKWDEYVIARRAYDGAEYGLKLAFRLVGVSDGADSSDGVSGRPRGAHDDEGARIDVEQYETPDWVFDPLHRMLHFTVDACASQQNAKLERYFTKEQNGLLQSWLDERVWCNPPYSEVAPWLEKAINSGAELVMMLLPARLAVAWWRNYVMRYATLVIIPPGRLVFGDFANVAT
jgi:site-specific DNA-methyltransferase (adenine-specific)